MPKYRLFFQSLQDLASQAGVGPFIGAAGGGNGVYLKHPEWHPLRIQVSFNMEAPNAHELVVEFYGEKKDSRHLQLHQQLESDRRRQVAPWSDARTDAAQDKAKANYYVAKVRVSRQTDADLMSPTWCTSTAQRALALVQQFLAYRPRP